MDSTKIPQPQIVKFVANFVKTVLGHKKTSVYLAPKTSFILAIL
jgi:hypothetical protein